jgi:hypothetical protein
LRIEFHVEDYEDQLSASYLVERNGVDAEVGLLEVREFDSMKIRKWLMLVRDNLAQAGRPKFTNCRIWMTAGGKYEAKYGQDEVDWDAIVPGLGACPGICV